MHNTALIDTLRTFSKQDLKEFGLFINSPFYNTNQSVIKMYNQIKILYPDFDEKYLDKKTLYNKSFGKMVYDDSFMRMTVFRLMELAKEFLVHVNLKRNNLLKETILLDELNNRELNKLLIKNIQELDRKIDKQKVKEADTYFVKYKMEYFRNDIKSRDTKTITYKDKLNKDLLLEQKNLNIFFFLSSLKFFQYFLNQKNFVVNTEGYPDFVNSILEYLKNNKDYMKVPAIKLYYIMTLLLLTEDDKYFFKLKKILFEDNDNLSYFEKFNLIANLRNYAQKKFNEGQSEFKTSVIEIIKFSIKKNILTTAEGGKYVSELRFMTIVWVGIVSNELNWIEKFIKEFINKIEPNKRQYVFAYNISILEFTKKNYTEALEILGKSGSIKNVFYKTAVKQLTLMIYYELKWYTPAFDLLDSYKHFIKTDKLLPEIYKSTSSIFIKYYSKLLKIIESTGDEKFVITKLISELKLTSQQWLLEKAEEFQKRSW
ncbi:MAG TPA: hypothetical protein PLD63_13010 [Ignavibacteria bacterium]|nr:hypothetical protein [Ignavibacteria bacterium]